MSTKQLQDAHNRKAELLIELGKGVNGWYRAGKMNNPAVEAICKEITKIDAYIGTMQGIMSGIYPDVCPQCRQALTSNTAFCQGCGFAVEQFLSSSARRCGKCGGTITADCKWCPICGAIAEAANNNAMQ